MNFKPTATIIGTGIQGCTIALQLQKRGYHINLIDQSPEMYRQASLNQEGKIHLGFIYAMDFSHKTAQKMLTDAMMFAPVMDKLIRKKIDWEKLKSKKFNYLVSRTSMLSPDFLTNYYTAVEEHYQLLLTDDRLHYLGKRPKRLFNVSKATSGYFNSDQIQSVFNTEEYAVDPVRIRQIFMEELRSQPQIKCLLNHQVTGITQDESGYTTWSQGPDKTIEIKSDIIINAAWSGKRSIDAFMGIKDESIWTHRLKAGFIFRPPVRKNIPSFSIVQGSYGDYVEYPHNNYVYYSWYPDCMLGQSSELAIPDYWQQICEGNFEKGVFNSIAEKSLQALKMILPDIDLGNPTSVRAGIILARGYRSINDPESELHLRADPPVKVQQGYFSINTGKFTSAPNNSEKLMELI